MANPAACQGERAETGEREGALAGRGVKDTSAGDRNVLRRPRVNFPTAQPVSAQWQSSPVVVAAARTASAPSDRLIDMLTNQRAPLTALANRERQLAEVVGQHRNICRFATLPRAASSRIVTTASAGAQREPWQPRRPITWVTPHVRRLDRPRFASRSDALAEDESHGPTPARSRGRLPRADVEERACRACAHRASRRQPSGRRQQTSAPCGDRVSCRGRGRERRPDLTGRSPCYGAGGASCFTLRKNRDRMTGGVRPVCHTPPHDSRHSPSQVRSPTRAAAEDDESVYVVQDARAVSPDCWRTTRDVAGGRPARRPAGTGPD